MPAHDLNDESARVGRSRSLNQIDGVAYSSEGGVATDGRVCAR